MNSKPHHPHTTVPNLGDSCSDSFMDSFIDSLTIRRNLLDLLQSLEEIETEESKALSLSNGWSEDHGADHQVILALENQGVRYILLRQPVQDSRTEAQALLSPREHEIARFIADGVSTKGIAVKLQISRWTVAAYVKRIFGKLGVNTRAQVAAAIARWENF